MSAVPEHVVWHDVECARYDADLPLWRELAAAAPAGRSSTSAPARAASRSTSPAAGHEVVALDLDAELLAALRERAAAERPARSRPSSATPARSTSSAATSRSSWRRCRPCSCSAARAGSASCAAARAHVAPGGLVAIALADALETFDADHVLLPLPDTLIVDGALYSQPAGRAARPRRHASRSSASARSSRADGRRSGERRRARASTASRSPRSRPRAARPGCDGAAGRLDRRDRGARRHERGDAPWLSRAPAATLRVCALYPDLMNIYADRGNLLMLERRCALARDRLRGDAPPGSATPSTPTRTTSSTSAAARTATSACARWTSSQTKRDGAARGRRRAARSMLGVCGGYQLLGHRYALGDEEIPGLGLVDLETVRSDGPRLIGNVAIEVELDGDGRRRVLAGFENHAGRTQLGAGERRSGAC